MYFISFFSVFIKGWAVAESSLALRDVPYVNSFQWRRGVVVINTGQLHSTKLELRFCARSNLASDVSKIPDREYLWKCSRLKIRLNAFRQSTIPQKQFIIIIKQYTKTTSMVLLLYNNIGFEKFNYHGITFSWKTLI